MSVLWGLARGTSRCFTVAGMAGVPANATAAVLNVTAVGYTTPGWLTLYPNGQLVPATSALDFDNQFAIANNQVLPVGASGQICVNAEMGNGVAGSSNVLIDAIGYLTGVSPLTTR